MPLLILSVPLLMVASYMVRCDYSMEEAWQATRHFGQSGTRYGQGFTEADFGSVRPGMKGDVVFELLGVPMEGHLVDGRPGTSWKYSLPKSGKPFYHERIVEFQVENGKPPVVASLIRRFRSSDDP